MRNQLVIACFLLIFVNTTLPTLAQQNSIGTLLVNVATAQRNEATAQRNQSYATEAEAHRAQIRSKLDQAAAKTNEAAAQQDAQTDYTKLQKTLQWVDIYTTMANAIDDTNPVLAASYAQQGLNLLQPLLVELGHLYGEEIKSVIDALEAYQKALTTPVDATFVPKKRA